MQTMYLRRPRLRRLMILLCCCLATVACESGSTTVDGGQDADMRDGGWDASVLVCAADRDCSDGLYCTRARCVPGAPTADSRGCVQVGSPCGEDERCDEGTETCTPVACGSLTDADGDGHRSIACGGNDCDDTDDHRFGGNTETCDVSHDEDCDETTVAGVDDGDTDGDGFTSAMCCNGTRCGDDCDDRDRTAFPGAREVCNGRDDDCDGAADEEGEVPLCPGGICTAGRCDLAAWSRTIGGVSWDAVSSVTMDDLGNVYVAGSFRGTAHFGGPSPTTTASEFESEGYIASYAADGAFRWVRTFAASNFWFGQTVWDQTAEQLNLTGSGGGTVDFGGGPRTLDYRNFLLVLGADGTYRWDRLFNRGVAISVAARNGPTIATTLEEGHTNTDFGGGDLTAIGGANVVVSRFTPDGTHVWDYQSSAADGAGSRASNLALAMRPDGQFAVIGTYVGSVNFGIGEHVSMPGFDTGDAFVLALDSTGRAMWDYVAGGSASDQADSVAFDTAGRLYVSGTFSDADFGGGLVTGAHAFLLRLSPSGVFTAGRYWGEAETSRAASVGVTSEGEVIVVGRYAGSINFGGGLIHSPSEAGYFVRFDPMLNHLADQTFAWPGHPTALCPDCTSEIVGLAIGPADSTVLAGAFRGTIELEGRTGTSAGESDGFVVRLPN